jgi:dipeptidyl aminopeptidase/acylaminoacyl peptidase
VVPGCGGSSSGAQNDSPVDHAFDLVFVRGGQDAGTYLLAVKSGRERRIGAATSEPTWSPDGERLAFSLLKDREHGTSALRLWVMDADGSNRQEIVGDDTAANPAWSPDGKQIAFTGFLGINLTEATGGGVRTLALEPSLPGSVDWSRDGSLLVVGASDGIYAIKMDGSGSHRLTRGLFDAEPVWSPDGKYIAFTRVEPILGPNSVYVMNADGTGIRRLTRGFDDWSPTWSPDGRQIAFARAPRLGATLKAFREANAATEIYVVEAQGGTPKRLTRNRVYDGSPDWRTFETVSSPPATTAGVLVTVPALERREMTLDELERVLGHVGLRLSLAGAHQDPNARWAIVKQAPDAGTEVPRGTVVQVAVFDVSDPFAGQEFDRRAWVAHPTCERDNPRGRMVKDLLENHLQEGTPRAQVLELLGRPEHHARGLDYPVGEWSGFRIDCDFLHVDFDPSGRLKRAYHWQS